MGKNCGKFVSAAFCLLLLLGLGLCQPVKSSKHDVRCLIYFFLDFRCRQSLTRSSLSLSVSLLVALSCTIFYIFMHDAFNHVMHMIFRRTLRPVPNLVPLLLCCISSISMSYACHDTLLPTPFSLLLSLCFGLALSGGRERERERVQHGPGTWGWSLALLRYVAFYVARRGALLFGATFPFRAACEPLESLEDRSVVKAHFTYRRL